MLYISKYVAKPEESGELHDTAELREREDMGKQLHFLEARVIGMPEAVQRTWGYKMRSRHPVTTLCTKLPHLRMRALNMRRGGNTAESDAEDESLGQRDSGDVGSDAESHADAEYAVYPPSSPPHLPCTSPAPHASPVHLTCSPPEHLCTSSAFRYEPERAPRRLKFADGTIEQYENRPLDSDDMQWEDMLYPEFHRRYRIVRGADVRHIMRLPLPHAARPSPLRLNTPEAWP